MDPDDPDTFAHPARRILNDYDSTDLGHPSHSTNEATKPTY